MNFAKAFEALKQGYKIKRPSWKGFWKLEGDNVYLHCKNGDIIPINKTQDVLYTLQNIAADDWEIVVDYDAETPSFNIQTFTFGEAVSRMKRGAKVSRKGWNGKGMYVVYRTGYPDGIECNKNTADALGVAEGTVIVIRPYMQMKCADGTFQMWLASQSDILADDWYCLEQNNTVSFTNCCDDLGDTGCDG